MDTKATLIATLIGAIVMFFGGWLIWGIALMSIHQAHTAEYTGLINEMPDMLLMAIAMIVTALLYAIIFERWAGIKTAKTGAKAGAVIAILSGLGYDLMSMASMNLIDSTIVLTDIAGNLVWGALAGAAIGWALGKFRD